MIQIILVKILFEVFSPVDDTRSNICTQQCMLILRPWVKVNTLLIEHAQQGSDHLPYIDNTRPCRVFCSLKCNLEFTSSKLYWCVWHEEDSLKIHYLECNLIFAHISVQVTWPCTCVHKTHLIFNWAHIDLKSNAIYQSPGILAPYEDADL